MNLILETLQAKKFAKFEIPAKVKVRPFSDLFLQSIFLATFEMVSEVPFTKQIVVYIFFCHSLVTFEMVTEIPSKVQYVLVLLCLLLWENEH